MAMRQWTNPSQPQTLQIAVFLLYINAAFIVLRGGFLSPFGLLFIAGGIGAGLGIAQEKRWGYGLGLAMALAPFVIRISLGGIGAALGANLINLMFEIALVALLLHPQSREYQRIWFS
jgi:hypothetical protein